MVDDPPNRFCVGYTIQYGMYVRNPYVPGVQNVNMTLNVSDTYPNGATERLETNLFLLVNETKWYYRSYVVEAGDVGTKITNHFRVNGTTEVGENVSDTREKDSYILDPGINITKVASPTSGALGTDVNFTITVTNTGDCTLDSVEVVDTLPVGMSFVSADYGGSESPPGSGTIIWDLGTMVSGATHAPIHLVAHIDVGAAGPLTNNVLATGTPENSMCDDVTDSDDAVVTVTYSIAGMKFNDLNGNGVKDAGEPGLPGWTINLEQPAGTVINSTTTAADGSYTFTNLEPGDYTVSEVLKAGWAQTCPPTPGTYSVTLTDSPVIDRDFGNRGALSISGMKFNDLNGDGVKDAGEPGLEDWTINLVGPVSGTTTTAADGSYTFTNLEPGDYTVSEVLKAGWAQTCPAAPGTYSVTLTDSPVIDRDFGNRGALSISGMKFNDLNGDGVKDAGEPGLGDWTINLAGPVSGTTTTAADGSYTFTNLEPGDYTVSEVLKPGWVQTCPAAPGTYSVTLTDSPVIDRDFGNRGALSISGMKFDDLNGNGVKDAGEPGLPDWTINLVGPVSGTTTTAADGSYTFTNLEPGDYTVSEVLKAGWAQTCPPTPGTYSVTLTDSPVIDRDFGNRGALSISGMKFDDLNGNGVKDAGEPGLGDWTINLAGPVSGTTTTAADGSYTFTNLNFESF
uniref:DUF11 domain-containing protein n=1 Tax=Candidatus Methanophaga sp. ANME-1 ERB7 TaxID=2759913 RepID=A0A7G9Z9R6_9EURY|nr:fibrinogen-binding protein-like [uncultured archaeon GZfos1D1]QNO57000.1 hypothetical protein MGAOFDBH_00018 [Methanosarcinales archaeon ANME-1 ERB7]